MTFFNDRNRSPKLVNRLIVVHEVLIGVVFLFLSLALDVVLGVILPV